MNNQNERNVKKLIAGRSMSLLGSGIQAIAITLFVLDKTDSLAVLGMFFSLVAIPQIILSPILGVYIEKFNRKTNIVVSDSVQGILYLFLFYLSLNDRLPIAVLLAVMALSYIIGSNFSIASTVLFSEITPKDKLEKMNSVKSICDNLSYLVSPALGAILYGAFGFSAVTLINALSYILSALIEMTLAYTMKPSEKKEKTRLVKELKEGIDVVVENHGVLRLFIIVMSINLFISPMDKVFSPGMFLHKYGLSESLYGIANSFFIVGTMLASMVIMKNTKVDFVSKLKGLLIANSLVLIAMGTASLLMFDAYRNLFGLVYIVLLTLCGVLMSMVNIPLISKLQKDVPVEYQGRFFGLLTFASSLLMPVGIYIAGFLSDIFGADTVFIFNNVVIILIVAFAYKNEKQADFRSEADSIV